MWTPAKVSGKNIERHYLASAGGQHTAQLVEKSQGLPSIYR